nr:ribonuclease H-like domain-containing protein [Tanacetum cinerariifolium]
MKRARTTYRDENKNNSFNHEDAWALLRSHSKWAAPGRVDLTEGEHVPVVNIEELFGPDARPRRPGKQRLRKKTKSDTSASTGGSSSSAQFEEFMTRKLHLKREATATLVYCDNVSAVYLSSNLVQHQRTKHIEIDIHFFRDLVSTGRIWVLHVPSHYQYVDIFTKGLPTSLFDEFRSSLSVRSSPAQTAGGC